MILVTCVMRKQIFWRCDVFVKITRWNEFNGIVEPIKLPILETEQNVKSSLD